MTSQPWLAEYLEQEAQEPGPYARDTASADAARRLRDLLADPDGWAEPPAGLLGQILAGIDSAAGRDDRRRQTQMRRTVRAGAVALLAAAAVVIGIVVTRGPAGTDVALAGTRLAPAASATAKLHATPSGLAIELDVSGLPPSPPGYCYQAWMKGPRGLVTIGTFHMRGGPGAVELITPGTYRATNLASQARLPITVAMPGQDEPYCPARPTLIRAGDHGFDPAAAHILAGQSIVLHAETPARFLVEPVPSGL